MAFAKCEMFFSMPSEGNIAFFQINLNLMKRFFNKDKMAKSRYYN